MLETERILLDDLEVGELATFYDDADPEEVLEWTFDRFGNRVAMVSSFQAEGVVLIDMAAKVNPDVRVITIDTGRLPQESYQLIDTMRARYGIPIEVLLPNAHAVEKMVVQHGVNLFYHDVPSRLLCCHVRKVIPLQRALRGLDGWITGLRREQWATRANIRKIELDHDHGGIVKINPLADWTNDEVWDYIRTHDVPYHPLYDQGYTSISCAPCTRPVPSGRDPRSGRWWWEENAPKECGMHCSLETGGFEHELEAILGKHGGNGRA
ncbi:MAG: phosphoadenylyl-sulfate reductase [Armatimonadetes bacterium]|nr:phosphoadenylyl-sulfate reductase [Armatimonadota bacterium]